MLALALVEVGRALEREVDRLGGAAGPHDLARIGANQVGHLAAGLLNGLFGLPTPGVAARGGVAEVLTQPGDHGIDHAGVNRGGSAVVKVNRKMGCHIHGWL